MRNILNKTLILILTILLMFPAYIPKSLAAGEELIPNGGFETLSSGKPTGWSFYAPNATLDSSTKHSGNYSAKITTQEGNNPWVNYKVIDIIPFAQYEITGWVNTAITTDGSRGVAFKAEFYSSTSASATTGIGGSGGYADYAASTNGQWVKISHIFTAPENCITVKVYCRLYCNGTVWFDDVSLKLTQGPEKFKFSTDDVFHYPDDERGRAFVKIDSFYDGTGLAENTRVDFKLSDGETVLDSQLNTTVTSNLSEYFYNVDLLTEKKKQYKVTAAVKDLSGNILREYSQNVYLYDRPLNVAKDGIYRINGEVFNPIFGYHVDSGTYANLAGSGINVVQVGYNNAVYAYKTTRQNTLKELQTNNLKALFCLYIDNKPAGHPDNIDNIKAVVNELKDDPRIFAWAIQDEPLGSGITDEKLKWLEDSYRAIRDIDSKHPTYIVDYSPSTCKESAKYCDIFAADIYAAGDTRGVTSLMKVNKQAVGDKKPLYYLGMTYKSNGYMPTIADVRGSVYRGLEEGAKAAGYYSISDAYGHDAGDIRTPLYNLPIWPAFCKFNTEELPILYNYFTHGKYQKFNNNEDDGANGLLWFTWINGNDINLVAHNRSTSSQSVKIPLSSSNGFVNVLDYTAEAIGGASGTVTGSGSMTLNLSAQQVVFYKITPAVPIDTNKLTYIPVPGFNNSFEEMNGSQLKVWGFGGNATQNSCLVSSASPQDGQYYIKLPAKDNSIMNNDFIAVEPNTTYVFSMWMRNSVQNSAYFDMRFFVDDVSLDNYTLGGFKNVHGMHYYKETFGDAHATEAERLKWRYVDFSFTTPPNVNQIRISVANASPSGDNYLNFDSLALAKNGDESNYVRNGRLDTFKGEGIFSGWTPSSGGYGSSTIVPVSENGNNYVKMYQPAYLTQEIYLFSGRYKLSFRYKNDSGASNKPMPRIQRSTAPPGFNTFYITDFPAVGTAGQWQNYSVYFTVPAAADISGYNFTLYLPGIYDNGTYYYDDIVVQQDNDSFVNFASEYESPGYNSDTFKTTEKIKEISQITDAVAVSGAYNIKTIGHYVPETLGQEDFKMLSAVYRYNSNGEKYISSISVKSGSAAGGAAANVYDTVSVPTGDENYKVEVLIWNSMTGMKPYLPKAVLKYN